MMQVEEIARRLGYVLDARERKWRRGDASVFIDGDLFKSFKPGYEHLSGAGVVSFVSKSEGVSFQNAYKLLESIGAGDYQRKSSDFVKTPVPEKRIKKLWTPPLIESHNGALYEYLCGERLLSKETVDECIEKGILYPSAENRFGNQAKEPCAVFVYRDNEGLPKAYQCVFTTGENKGEKKLTYGSKREICTCRINGTSPGDFIVFEATIDMLSFIDLGYWHGETLVAFGGSVNPSEHPFLKDRNFNALFCGFDNDQPGNTMFNSFRNVYPDMQRIIPQEGKDFNDELKAKHNNKENLMKKKDRATGERFYTNSVDVHGKILYVAKVKHDGQPAGGITGVINTGHGSVKFYADGEAAKKLEVLKPGDMYFLRGFLRNGKSERYYLRVSASGPTESTEEKSLFKVYANIVRIDRKHEDSYLITAVNHDRISPRLDISTNLHFYVSAKAAEYLKSEGVGSYAKITGSLSSRKDPVTGDWYNNLFVKEVDIIRSAADIRRDKAESVEPAPEVAVVKTEKKIEESSDKTVAPRAVEAETVSADSGKTEHQSEKSVRNMTTGGKVYSKESSAAQRDLKGRDIEEGTAPQSTQNLKDEDFQEKNSI